MMQLVRFSHPTAGTAARVGVVQNETVYDITEQVPTISAWLNQSTGRVAESVAELATLAEQAVRHFPLSDLAHSLASNQAHLLAPVDGQEVWAAGVTYERSREARQEEAEDGGDVYARVYDAPRPEIFFKAQGWRAVGPGADVGIRSDATWSVPEAELGVVYNPALEVVGFTIGNDMSSRDIEGANPLYLPQAKIYTASCALGPGITLHPSDEWPDATISIVIERAGQVAFAGDVHTAKIKRTIRELADYLGHSYQFPDGVVLLTGTGTVPPSDFTLAAGDVVRIEIEGLGSLTNIVKVV
jgi:2-dehydro-3-deoxy-D-arabinonate dehydratase